MRWPQVQEHLRAEVTKMSREQLEEHGLRQVKCLGFPEVSWAARGASPLSFAVDLEVNLWGQELSNSRVAPRTLQEGVELAGVHGGLT